MRHSIMLVAVPFLTAACSTSLQQARMEIRADASSTAQLFFSSDTTPTGAGDLARYETMARECGALTRRFGGRQGERSFLDINFSAATRDELEVALQCARTHDDRFPELTIETSDGILGQTYVLKMNQIIPFKLFDGLGTAKEFTFTMPGEITEFVDRSIAPGVEIRSARVGGNRLRIQLTYHTDSVEAIVKRTCPSGSCPEAARDLEKNVLVNLKFQVTSKKSKLDIPALTAIAGLFLGSGLLVEIGRRMIARKKRPPPPVP